MPQPPDATFAPSIDVDDSKKYVVQVEGIEELPSNWREKNPNAMQLRHKFLMFDYDTGVGVIDDSTGELFELWKSTNDMTYENPKTGRIAPAREFANALLGKTLSDEDVRHMLREGITSWEADLKGKRAIADVEWKPTQTGGRRLDILRLKPYTKKAPRTLDDEAA
jgi:hypothetical protein